MKNIPLLDFHYLENLQFNHFFRIMKVTTFFLFFSVFCLMAGNSHSQNARVTISKDNARLEDVLNEIESQTSYLFIYSNHVDVARKVSVNANEKPVSEVLTKLFKGTDIHYSMEGTHIILSEKERNESTSVTQQSKRIINGKVTDMQNEPIIGANIHLKGASTGTITDIEGHFNLEVPENATLLVSFVGYAPVQINIGNKKEVSLN